MVGYLYYYRNTTGVNTSIKVFTEENKPFSQMMNKYQTYGLIYYLDEIIKHNIELIKHCTKLLNYLLIIMTI